MRRLSKKTVSFRTFGCKQNQYDTDFLRESFEAEGFTVVDGKAADVVVINTCAVTSRSAQKCRQAIRAAAKAGSKVVVTGCYPQIASGEVEDLPGVIAVSGVRDRSRLAEIVAEALETGDKLIRVTPHTPGESFEDTPVRTPSLTRAFLKIQEGCGDFCTYCIVPYARGPSRSRPPDSVVKEAESLVRRGYKEIILTGTHIGLYSGRPGSDGGVDTRFEQHQDLPELIRRVSEIPGLIRLRISSLEPHDVTDALIHCLRLPNVCHHLHLPLQSGSDRILKMMGRRYDVPLFIDIIQRARNVAPDLGLTTDLIAGFPGETEEDFQETLAVAKAAGFSRIHAFKYSARPGTRAHAFPGKVPEKEKEERVKRLISLGGELSLAFHRKHVGRDMEVLIEDDRDRDGSLAGFTRNYIRCHFQGEDDLKGKVVSVRVTEAAASGVLGDPR
jgi:threonylcarbamoyladenosine tRNA methylthiotransferase MtaB